MNPTKPSNLISRKEIALMIAEDVSAEQVRKNEVRWGLRRARRDLNCRCVRYLRRIALEILRGRGFIE